MLEATPFSGQSRSYTIQRGPRRYPECRSAAVRYTAAARPRSSPRSAASATWSNSSAAAAVPAAAFGESSADSRPRRRDGGRPRLTRSACEGRPGTQAGPRQSSARATAVDAGKRAATTRPPGDLAATRRDHDQPRVSHGHPDHVTVAVSKERAGGSSAGNGTRGKAAPGRARDPRRLHTDTSVPDG
jgi:hypothetical protein